MLVPYALRAPAPVNLGVRRHMSRPSLHRLIQLFNMERKREIERYCNDLVITSEDLTDILLAAQVAGIPPYLYACHFHDIQPESLQPTDEQLAALSQNGVGPLGKQAAKVVRKVDQMFKNRRLLAIHLFYTPNQKYWHLFYFDQRDYSATDNHWKHGPHIHYCHDSFTNEPLESVWAKATAEKPQLPPELHIRYDYHHNRGQTVNEHPSGASQETHRK